MAGGAVGVACACQKVTGQGMTRAGTVRRADRHMGQVWQRYSARATDKAGAGLVYAKRLSGLRASRGHDGRANMRALSKPRKVRGNEPKRGYGSRVAGNSPTVKAQTIRKPVGTCWPVGR